MPRLLVLQPYRATGVRYQPGEVVEVSDDEAARHLADSPQWFALVADEADLTATPPPPPDKMIRSAPVKKGAKPADEPPPPPDGQTADGQTADGAEQP